MPRRERIRVQSTPTGESKTEQAHRQKVNINSIMSKYNMTGVMPSTRHPAMYGDFTTSGDFHSAMNRIIDAQQEFASLPSKIRNRFDNDPGKLIDFLSDPANLKEAYDLELIPRPEGYIPFNDVPGVDPSPEILPGETPVETPTN